MTDDVRVAVVSPVHRDLLDWLRARATVHYLPEARQADLRATAVAGCDVLVLRSNVRLGADEVAALPRLRLVVRAGSGTDNLDLPALLARDVDLVRTGGTDSAPAVAELALQASIALLRRVPQATAELAAGTWAKGARADAELAGSTVAVWGAGPVGRAVARLFGLLGPTVVFARHASVPSRFVQAEPATLARVADVHVFALPRRPETVGYVGAALLDLFRPRRPHLVNVGRWDLFDMPRVFGALCRGDLSGLAVDPVERAHVAEAAALVARFASPGQALNLQLTPHLGAMTEGAFQRVAASAISALEPRWDALLPAISATRDHQGADDVRPHDRRHAGHRR